MIGIFDSGIGGLTVLKAIQQRLPQYQLLYLGDTARTPYGNRSQDLIYRFTEQAVDFLFQQGCHLVIVACNTASAEALRKIQQQWLPAHYPSTSLRTGPDRRLLGVSRPGVEVAAIVSRSGRIGVVGTRGTIASGAFERELRVLRPDAAVFAQACPLLVPLVEEGWQERPETMKIIRHYLRPIKLKKIDTLILGCTHYPMLFKQFQRVAGKSITVLDSATIVAEKLKDYLQRHPEIETNLVRGDNHRFLVTDAAEIFQQNANRWLGQTVVFEKVALD